MNDNKIRILTNMLLTNIEEYKGYSEQVENYLDRKKSWKVNNPTKHDWQFNERYPVLRTSKTNIRNIATLLRKEILNTLEELDNE